MAKGNMLLGYSRGSVGDVVFSRSKGQQVQRARNRNPNNPKTFEQVLQRAYFASNVAAFTIGNQAAFKYAFTNKKESQSDYNAFMSKNAAPAMSRQQKEKGVVLPYEYIISEGSLGNYSTEIIISAGDVCTGWNIPSGITSASSVGEMNRAIAERYGNINDGDIVTFLAYTMTGGKETYTNEDVTDIANGNLLNSTTAIVCQHVFNFSDSRAIADITGEAEGNVFVEVDEGGSRKLRTTFNVEGTGLVVVFGAIKSRVSPTGKVEVSTSKMMLNGPADSMQKVIYYNPFPGRGYGPYIDAVMSSYEWSPNALLKGGMQ